jgi:hypothetical protein
MRIGQDIVEGFVAVRIVKWVEMREQFVEMVPAENMSDRRIPGADLPGQ